MGGGRFSGEQSVNLVPTRCGGKGFAFRRRKGPPEGDEIHIERQVRGESPSSLGHWSRGLRN